jgi:hypothetical protein
MVIHIRFIIIEWISSELLSKQVSFFTLFPKEIYAPRDIVDDDKSINHIQDWLISPETMKKWSKRNKFALAWLIWNWLLFLVLIVVKV